MLSLPTKNVLALHDNLHMWRSLMRLLREISQLCDSYSYVAGFRSFCLELRASLVQSLRGALQHSQANVPLRDCRVWNQVPLRLRKSCRRWQAYLR